MRSPKVIGWLVGVGLAGLLVGAGAGAGEEEALPMIGDVTNGTRLYRTHCTVCHGFSGTGAGPARTTLRKPAADHRNGALMNSRDNAMLFSTIQNGCKARGCSATMPAFGASLGDLDLWDLVAYLRSLHLPLVVFFPKVDQYVVKQYAIGQLGNEDFRFGQKDRIKKFAGKVSAQDLEQTVFTLFRSGRQRSDPVLVPQEPRQLAKLNKDNKLGYVLFMELIGPRDRKVPVGLALDRNYAIAMLVTSIDDPGVAGEYNRRLAQYVGMGKRGDRPEFSTGKDSVSKLFDAAVVRLYTLAVEAANCYELEERERSWADDTF
jgi:mono/diheme cytochrome c family protein